MTAERGRLDTVHAVVGLVCVVAMTTTFIVLAIRSDRRATKTADELRAGARALQGNFDGHQCAPPAPPMPMQTEN